MKILHLTTIAMSHQLLLRPQLLALRDAGHEVVAVSADGPEVAQLQNQGIRHRVIDGSTRGFDLRADRRAISSFCTVVRDEQPDLVHTHNPKPGIYGRILARVLGVPRVVNTVHGLYATDDDSFQRRAAVYGLEGLAATFSHLELVQSIEDVELMRSWPHLPGDRVRHLGNGIDVRRFSPSDEDRRDVRRELGLTEDAAVAIAVGRLVSEKGFNELFSSWPSVRTNAERNGLPLPHLLVVGIDDPQKADALPRDVIARAKADGVQLLSHRDDVDRLLRASDVFVLPSYREGVPRAAMEAAATGLPIVATDIRGCRQVVDDGASGRLVPRMTVEPLADALSELLHDAALRRAFGAAGRAKAEREFDERDVIARLLDAYAELGVS